MTRSTLYQHNTVNILSRFFYLFTFLTLFNVFKDVSSTCFCICAACVNVNAAYDNGTDMTPTTSDSGNIQIVNLHSLQLLYEQISAFISMPA